jgi:Holliday junction resolvase RusA-like endonuclease
MAATEHEVKHQFVVLGKPIAQPRHRVCCQGGYARTYLPSDHPVHAYKALLVHGARTARIPMMEGPVRLDIMFSFARKRKQAREFKISKPDLDNLDKAVMDALTEAGVWGDDAQVVEKHSIKVWNTVDATSVFISPVEFGLSERLRQFKS